jgi:PTH1 family peptidyl-tRNA hydrolase
VTAIIGLGNPGSEYEGTRHNVGFLVVDAICEALKTAFRAGKGEYVEAASTVQGIEVLLIKPLTYMNNSGVAVADVLDRYNLQLNDILVVSDDFNLPLGTIRLRPKGSDGGHNGLYSIIYQLGTEEFARLRCGIGRPALTARRFDATAYVLSVFEPSELPIVKGMLRSARDAALCFVTEGIERAMSRWNTDASNLEGREIPVE